MKKKDTAPNRRARKCLPLDSGSRMSAPSTARYAPSTVFSSLFLSLCVFNDFNGYIFIFVGCCRLLSLFFF